MSAKVTPLKAIRANCLECCCGSAKEVRGCHIERCPLWPYRLGKNPNRAKTREKPPLNASFPGLEHEGGVLYGPTGIGGKPPTHGPKTIQEGNDRPLPISEAGGRL